MKPRALVTGSAGFVGRHIAKLLETSGYHVTRCDPRHTKLADSSDCRATFSSVYTTSGMPVTWDLVVHCAAMVDGREAIENKAALLGAYNLQLDGALFEWALSAKPGRIVYFSSSAAYPVHLQSDPGHVLCESDLDGDPDATYGWVKLTGERIAREVRAAGIPVTVVRPFSGYGEDQDDCYPFPAIIGRARRREWPFRVWGDGQQVRDFIHIDDIAAAVLTLVEKNIDGPVNLGTGRGTSIDDLARMAMRAVGYLAPIHHLVDKPSGVLSRVCDTSLIDSYYEREISLECGIDRAIAACSIH